MSLLTTMKSQIRVFIGLGILFFSVFQCKPTDEKLNGNAITALTVSAGSTDYKATINGTTITFANSVPYGTTQVSIKALTLSEKANADKKVGDVLTVGSNTITVTAEDGNTAAFTVTITASGPSSQKAITAIAVTTSGSSLSYAGTISGTHVIINDVPESSSTQVTISTLTLSEFATANKSVGDALAITGATLVVTAQDKSTQTYTFTINTIVPSSEKDITAMTINVNGTTHSANFGGTNRIVFLPISSSTLTTAPVIKSLTLSAKATSNKSVGDTLTLTGGTVVVTAENGSTKNYYISYADYTEKLPSVFDIRVDGNYFHNPSGIWADGTTMYVANDHFNKILAIDISSREQVTSKQISLASDNSEVNSIWSDGTTIWAVDYNDDSIYAYNLSNGTRDTSKDFNAQTLTGAGNMSPNGIWSDGTTMWVLDEQDNKIYAYTLNTKARDASKDINTISSGGWSIWSDGTTLWVANNNSDELHAYTLATGARDSAKDYRRLSNSNSNPFGIWSNGKIMWVADFPDRRLYAYVAR